METCNAPADVPDPWIYRGVLIFAFICILIEMYRVWSCYQSPCCEMHWLLLNKESVCPVFTLGNGGFQWPV